MDDEAPGEASCQVKLMNYFITIERIGLAISNLISMRRVVATLEAGNEVELCVITVAPLKDELAFLDKERCFIQSGASTRQIKGPDQFQYQRSRAITRK